MKNIDQLLIYTTNQLEYNYAIKCKKVENNLNKEDNKKSISIRCERVSQADAMGAAKIHLKKNKKKCIMGAYNLSE